MGILHGDVLKSGYAEGKVDAEFDQREQEITLTPRLGSSANTIGIKTCCYSRPS
jgi:hypothetical protein